MKYEAICEGGETIQFESRDDQSAWKRAEKWVLEADWGRHDHTIWVEYGIKLATDEDWSWDTITIDPPEPKCVRKRHKWMAPVSVVGGLRENPGVYGHGGGVKITTCCKFCGMFRTYDTWAQNPENGQQGLDSTSYREPTDRSLDWVSKGGKEDE